MQPEAKVNPSGFNQLLELPYSLRFVDFEIAMQDVYDLFRDINGLLLERGLNRLEETFRPAAMSGFISDLLTAILSNHARSLTANPTSRGATETAFRMGLQGRCPATVAKRAPTLGLTRSPGLPRFRWR